MLESMACILSQGAIRNVTETHPKDVRNHGLHTITRCYSQRDRDKHIVSGLGTCHNYHHLHYNAADKTRDPRCFGAQWPQGCEVQQVLDNSHSFSDRNRHMRIVCHEEYVIAPGEQRHKKGWKGETN
jgi:hypothetical protein